MLGIVEVFQRGNLIESGSNMILDNTGELIVDFLTVPRALSGISSASAILDTSNYTVRAASLGKDALGYNYHAHHPTLAAYTSGDGIIRVVSYGGNTVSSYHTSSFGLSAGVNILPQASIPRLERLEANSTLTSAISGGYNVGHNPNLVPRDTSSAVFGCFAPSGSSTVYLLPSFSSPNSPIASATLSNVSGHNCYLSAIDTRGFLLMTASSLAHGKTKYDVSAFEGLIMTHTAGWSDPGGDLTVRYVVGLFPQDIIFNNFFGGIYTIGLWGFDMKSMVAEGLLPPYSRDQLESMSYKLLARKTFTKDITYYNDNGSSAGLNILTEPLEIIWRWVFG